MDINNRTEWIRCPLCGGKTRDRIRADTLKAYLWGAHFPMKRHLKCPKCSRTGYCEVVK